MLEIEGGLEVRRGINMRELLLKEDIENEFEAMMVKEELSPLRPELSLHLLIFHNGRDLLEEFSRLLLLDIRFHDLLVLSCGRFFLFLDHGMRRRRWRNVRHAWHMKRFSWRRRRRGSIWHHSYKGCRRRRRRQSNFDFVYFFD